MEEQRLAVYSIVKNRYWKEMLSFYRSKLFSEKKSVNETSVVWTHGIISVRLSSIWIVFQVNLITVLVMILLQQHISNESFEVICFFYCWHYYRYPPLWSHFSIKLPECSHWQRMSLLPDYHVLSLFSALALTAPGGPAFWSDWGCHFLLWNEGAPHNSKVSYSFIRYCSF